MARSLVSIAIAVLAAACAGVGGASPPPTTGPGATSALTPSSTAPPAATPQAMTVIPQSLLDQMLLQVSELSSVPVDQLTVVSAEAVTWPDGSLGCPEPGMMYTQALVDGYQVVIRAGATTYDFHGTGNNFRLCPEATRGPKPTIEIPPPPIQEPADRY